MHGSALTVRFYNKAYVIHVGYHVQRLSKVFFSEPCNEQTLQ